MAAGGTIQAQNEAAGYVISVEGEKVYIDLAAGKVKPGDKVAVYSKEGYFIHPVTKKRLKREPSQVASLEVVKVYTDYSLAKGGIGSLSCRPKGILPDGQNHHA